MPYRLGAATSDIINHGVIAGGAAHSKGTTLLWVRPETLTDQRRIYSLKAPSIAPLQLSLSGTGGDILTAHPRVTASSSYIWTAGLVVNRWWFLAHTFDKNGGTANVHWLYVGQPDIEAALATIGTRTEGSGTFRDETGASFETGNNDSNTVAFQGAIAAACYVDERWLTPSEMIEWQMMTWRAIWAGRRGARPLIPRWPECRVNSIYDDPRRFLDWSGYGAHAVPSGGAYAGDLPGPLHPLRRTLFPGIAAGSVESLVLAPAGQEGSTEQGVIALPGTNVPTGQEITAELGTPALAVQYAPAGQQLSSQQGTPLEPGPFGTFWHFDEGFVPPEFYEFGSGTGTVEYNDSEVQFTCPNPGDAAALVYGTKIDKTKTQLWRSAHRWSDLAKLQGAMRLISSVSQPGAAPQANWDDNTIAWLGATRISSVNYLELDYQDGANVFQSWILASNTWGASPQQSTLAQSNDDFVILGLQIDGPGGRFRMLAWHNCAPSGTTLTHNQGPYLVAMTDWVLWSATLFPTSTDLWLAFGHPLTDLTDTGTNAAEWIELADASVEPAFCNVRDLGNAGNYEQQVFYVFASKAGHVHAVPVSRSLVLVGGTQAWETGQIKDKSLVFDGTTYWLLYNSPNGTQLGYASATDPYGAWTKYASNPILTAPAGVYSAIQFPLWKKDLDDPDPNKRWKLFYTGFRNSDGKAEGRYATAPAPSGPWTDRGVILAPSATAGDFDEQFAQISDVIYDRGLWRVLYQGAKNATLFPTAMGIASGTSLTALVRETAVLPFLSSPVEAGTVVEELATASIQGARSVSVADSSGFVKDDLVAIAPLGTDGNVYNLTKVRKVTPGGLEFYHRLRGYPIGNAPLIRTIDAGKILINTLSVRPNGELWAFTTTYQAMRSHTGYPNCFIEIAAVYKSASGLMEGPWSIDRLSSPFAYHTNLYAGARSTENPAIASTPISYGTIRQAFGQQVAIEQGVLALAVTLLPAGQEVASQQGTPTLPVTFSIAGQELISQQGANLLSVRLLAVAMEILAEQGTAALVTQVSTVVGPVGQEALAEMGAVTLLLAAAPTIEGQEATAQQGLPVLAVKLLPAGQEIASEQDVAVLVLNFNTVLQPVGLQLTSEQGVPTLDLSVFPAGLEVVGETTLPPLLVALTPAALELLAEQGSSVGLALTLAALGIEVVAEIGSAAVSLDQQTVVFAPGQEILAEQGTAALIYTWRPLGQELVAERGTPLALGPKHPRHFVAILLSRGKRYVVERITDSET